MSKHRHNAICRTPECGHRHEEHAKPGANQKIADRGACLHADGSEDGCACQRFTKAPPDDEQWGDGPGDRASGRRR